jgi:hypothetical protein
VINGSPGIQYSTTVMTAPAVIQQVAKSYPTLSRTTGTFMTKRHSKDVFGNTLQGYRFCESRVRGVYAVQTLLHGRRVLFKKRKFFIILCT